MRNRVKKKASAFIHWETETTYITITRQLHLLVPPAYYMNRENIRIIRTCRGVGEVHAAAALETKGDQYLAFAQPSSHDISDTQNCPSKQKQS